MPMDNVDRKLLNLIQTDFPLTPEPYADLALRLGTGFDEVIRRIERLKEKGIIRLIGPVLDSRSLGYHSTLIAMKVNNADLEKAEQVIAAHPGVSHGYERDYQFNVWFTLALPPASDIESELAKLVRATGAENAFSLPALKIFKIGAYFDMDDDEETTPLVHRKSVLNKRIELSVTDRLIINELQQNLTLVATPFSAMAVRVGIEIDQFLAGCRSLQDRGIIRRFSASIDHRNAGFIANGMSCWIVPPHKIETTGKQLASLKEVSHCYERETNRMWHYNIFAMVHSRSRELCRNVTEKVAEEIGIIDNILLFSTKEFKKTRVKYLV